MAGDIMELSNRLFYGGQLLCGHDGVEKQQLLLPLRDELLDESACPEFVRELLAPRTQVVWCDTDAATFSEEKNGKTVVNVFEANVIAALAK